MRLSRRRFLGATVIPAAAALTGVGAGVGASVGAARTAAANGATPFDVLLFGGQSNAGPAPAGGISPPLLGAEFPASALTFAGTKGYAPGRTLLDGAALTALAPQDDRPWGAQLAATAMSFALENGHLADGTASPGYFAFSAGEGGVPLEYLTRGAEASGHFSFVNTLAAASRVQPVLGTAGGSGVCHAYVFIHGENGPTAVSPPDLATKRTVYRTMLAAYADDVTAELQSRLGQTFPPEFVLLQTNAPDHQVLPTYDPYLAGGVLAQLDLARERLGQGVTMAGPAYHTRLADSVHTDNLGRLIVGELLAEVYRTIRAGATFQPLWPTSATLRGRIVLIRFEVPGGRLLLDTDWVAPVPHYGFTYSDDASSATIESVELASSNTVCIKLSAQPTGTRPVIRYALGNEQPLTQDHWSSARGQLYSDSGRPSHYAAAGFPIPPTVRHYAVRFDAPLS
ncbi:hypothetical protein [Jiangella mangrovi]|uniref:SGNH/GDSL hydrolase family protein n=1 Tax=Jiangella mangrovi TaxID=1524084 RepID=A0A7W9GW92_9ACTN|nr:hypothetical protein [Jiangella mangrovi]MBB5791122.1 hypothetical protein [Jiangella mangrovi]